YQDNKFIKMIAEEFEYLNLVSNYLMDADIENGNNFALYRDNSKWHLTRFDFDDTFKTFDILKISRGQTAGELTRQAEIFNSLDITELNTYYNDEFRKKIARGQYLEKALDKFFNVKLE